MGVALSGVIDDDIDIDPISAEQILLIVDSLDINDATPTADLLIKGICPIETKTVKKC